MSSLTLLGDTSGSVVLDAPPISGSTTITFAARSGTLNVAGPAFNAYASTTQSLASGTYTKVNLGTEVFDTNNNFASSTFTPTVAGYYIITGTTIVQSAAAALVVLIYKNGSSVAQGTSYPASGQISATATISSVIYCNGSTDYIDLYAYQGTAGSVTIGSGVSTQMTGCFLRGA